MGRKKRKNRSPEQALPPSDPIVAPVREKPGGGPFLWVAVTLLFLLGLSLGIREIDSPDIGLHLSTARWILDNGGLPKTDILTYTVSDHPYIDLQWLFQLIVYGWDRLAGSAGIISVTTMLTLVFAALLLFRAWRREGALPLSSFALLFLFFFGNFWEPRPHLLSWIWGTLVLIVLEEYGRGNRRWLPALPFLMMLWVNSHSLFVLGLVIIGAYGVGELRKGRAIDRRFVLWSFAAVAACLLNPYHVNGFLFPLTQFRDIQGAAGFKSAQTGIAEFTSPFTFDGYFAEGHFVLFQVRFFWQIFTVLALVGLIGAWRRSRLAEILLYFAFLYVFWRANKNFGYFVMVAFPMVASGLDRIVAGWPKRLSGHISRVRLRRLWLCGCSAVCLFAMLLVCSGGYADLAWMEQRPGFGFCKATLPVDACEFMEERGIEGRILNSWNDGGYISWTTGEPVFVVSHGEVMGPEFFEEYVRVKEPQGFEAALTKWDPSVAVVSFATTPYWLYALSRDEDWRIVFADEHTALFLRKEVSPEVTALPRLKAGEDFPEYDLAAARELIGKAAGARSLSLWEWFRGRAAYPTCEMLLSSFYLQTNQLDACIGVSLQGIEQTPFFVPDLMLNLGHVLNARGLYDLADVCFDAFLERDGDPVIAGEIAAVRQSRRR